MTNPPDGPTQHHDEHSIRDVAIADALYGSYTPPPPGRLHIVYHIAYSLVNRMRSTVEQDLHSGRFDPPSDPTEHHIYSALYTYFQQPQQPPATGETQRLSPPSHSPRVTGRCSDCLGQLEPIWLVDEGRRGQQQELVYTRPDAQPSFWLGTFPVLGRVEAFLCGECGRIFLYGQPTPVIRERG